MLTAHVSRCRLRTQRVTMQALVDEENGRRAAHVVLRSGEGSHDLPVVSGNRPWRADFDEVSFPRAPGDLEYPIVYAVERRDAVVIATGPDGICEQGKRGAGRSDGRESRIRDRTRPWTRATRRADGPECGGRSPMSACL